MAEARLLLLFSVFLLCRSVNYASNEKEKMLANEGLAQCKQAESQGHPCIEVSGSASYASNEKEKTLAMIKPDGLLGNHSDKVKEIILKSRFDILKEMMVQLDERNVTLFYAEHSKKSFFPSLIKYMTSGPVLVMVLEKENAVADWRALIGPTDAKKAKTTHPESIRAICGTDSSWNCVHGSDSPKSASREISFFFGEIYLTAEKKDIHFNYLLSNAGHVSNHDEL